MVLTLADASGNSSTCTSTVTVQDTTSPNAICQNISINLDSAGVVSIVPGDIDNLSNDACGIDTLVLSQSTFACGDVGSNTVSLWVTDNNGNIDSCTAVVMVHDSIAPTAICQNISVLLDSTGFASIQAAQIDNASNDACGIMSISASDTSFSCADIGSNTVTLTVTDNNGNTSTCTSTVTVNDSVVPVAICQNLTVFLDTAGTANISAAMVNNGSGDACGIDTLVLSMSNFDCNNTVAALTALPELLISEYVEGSSFEKYIEIYNGTGQAVDLSNYELHLYTNGSATISTSSSLAPGGMLMNGATVVFKNSGSVATTGIVLPAVNWNGDDAVELFNVNTGQTVDIFGNIGNDPGTAWTSGSISTANQTLRRKSTVQVGVTVNPGGTGPSAFATLGAEWDAFPINDTSGLGAHTVTMNSSNSVVLYVTDNNGNVDSCIAEITVLDSIAPNVSCTNISVYLDSTGNASIVSADVASATDACGIAMEMISLDSFSCGNVGPNTVTYMAADFNGNLDSCQSIVTIIDTIAPVVTCTNIDLYLNSGGMAMIVPGDIGTSTDACGISNVTISQDSFYCANVGVNTVLYSAFDNNSNMDSCSATVTVHDTIAPVVVCNQDTVYLDTAGMASIVASNIGTANDACGISSTAIDTSNFTCANVGANTVTFTATDVNGNTNSCTTTVSVIDSISPVVICVNLTLQLDNAGIASISSPSILGSSSDVCGIANESLSQSSFNCGDLGMNSITYTATDANGNVSSCISMVTVEDTIAPIWANCPSNISVFADSATCASSVTWSVPTVTDNCSIANSSNNFNSGSAFPIGNTTVSYVAIDSSGNADSCVFVVTVTPQPLLATVTSSMTSCGFNLACAGDANATATVAVSGGCLPYQFAWSNGQSSAMATGLAAGTYYVTVTDSLGAFWSDSLVISAPMPLTLTYSADSLVCGNETTGAIDLNVSGGNSCAAYSFAWSNGATTEDISGLMAGTYTVTVTDTLGCMSVISHTFIQGAIPSPSLGPDLFKCPGTGISLQTALPWTSYLWSNGDTNSITTANTAGVYWVEVSSNQGCIGRDTIVVSDFAVDNDIITAMGSLTICDGDSVVLVADSGLTNLAWSTGEVSSSITVAGFGGPITLTANDGNGCFVTETDTVNYIQFADPLPVITPGPEVMLCDGDNVTLNVQSGYFSYSWSNGATTQTLLVNTPGTYQVTVANGFGCEAVSDPVLVIGVPLPTPSLSLNSGVLSTTTPFATYQWFMDGNIIPGAIQPTFTPTVSGWYNVMVTDSNGCAGNSDSIFINPVGVAGGLVELEGLVLYPNPSSGIVNLRTENPIRGNVEVEVWDMFGQKVKVFSLSQLISDVDFDLTDIANGMYLMKVRTVRGMQQTSTMIRFMIE